MKYALIGVGRWGLQLAEAFKPFADIVCYCSTGDPLRDARAKELLGVERRPMDDWRWPKAEWSDVVHDREIDFVVIATSPETHYQIALAALIAGKHVFVEKPMTSNYSEAGVLVQASQQCERQLFVGYRFLYHPQWTDLLLQVEHDRPVYAEFEWKKWGSFEYDLLHTMTCHQMACARSLFGGQQTTTTVTHRLVGKTPLDAIEADLTFEWKRRARVKTTRYWGLQAAHTVHVELESGKTIDVDLTGPYELTLPEQAQVFLTSCQIGRFRMVPTDGILGADVVAMTEALR